MTTSPTSGAPILVIGGGIAGISAAVEASEAGHEVYLVERNEYLGGRVVQMHKYFPKLCPPTCGIEIHLKRLRTTPRVHLLTGTEVTGVSGGPGAFEVELTTRPRGVNEKCTACGECVDVCPKDRPNAYNYGLDTTKAIYLPFGSAYPFQYAIDFDHCDGESCGKCVEACKYDAVELKADKKVETVKVASIVVATGWKPYDENKLEHLAGGKAANVVTNVQMERFAALDGPTGGKILRPSDSAAPKHVAFVQCAGSRDEENMVHCSAVCCTASLKQMTYVLEQSEDVKVTLFYIDRRVPGRLETMLQELEGNERVSIVKGKVANITEGASGNVTLVAEDTLTGDKIECEADLAVLATGLEPEAKTAGFPDSWKADEHGFLPAASPFTGDGVAPGVYAAGTAKRPGDVSGAVKDATGSVLKAVQTARQA